MKSGKRKFRAFIINRQTILVYVSVIASVLIIGMLISMLNFIHIKDDVTDIYKHILLSGIPAEEDDSIFIKILGFDLRDKSTILYSNPIFSPISYSLWSTADMGNEQYYTPSPPPEKTEKTEETEKTDSGDAPVEQAVEKNKNTSQVEQINISRGMDVSNATDFKVDPIKLSKEPLDFKINKKDVEVLIEHTHTTEAYFNNGSNTDRNLDENKNMIAVGEKITAVLNERGIKTVHDKTIHDYPSYNGSYGRSLTTVKNNLAKYPNIKVVLDVHRDSIERNNKKVKVCANINGKTSSQVMLVIGTNAMGLSHDKWRENFKFASHIQSRANEKYPTLMRPLNLRQERFNMHMTTGSLIVEVGTSGNTLDEALLGAESFASVLADVLEGA